MGMSDYVRGLREKIGHDYLLIPAACSLIRDDRGRVLLVQHVEGRWQLPGGAVDPDESPQDAARRECREEASIEVELGAVLGVFGGPDYRAIYENRDEVGIVSIVFEGRIVDGAPRAGDDETQDVRWFARDELVALELRATTRGIISELLGGPG